MRISAATLTPRILLISSAGRCNQSANCERRYLMTIPSSNGNSCVVVRVAMIPSRLICGASPPRSQGRRRKSKIGETIVDEAASAVISPAAAVRFPPAIATSGGPNGAPGKYCKDQKAGGNHRVGVKTHEQQDSQGGNKQVVRYPSSQQGPVVCESMSEFGDGYLQSDRHHHCDEGCGDQQVEDLVKRHCLGWPA